jgi:hypothetical protein
MNWSAHPWEPPIGAFRARFQTSEPLSAPERESLLRELAGDSPRAPNEGHIGPDGGGWLLYAGESLTASIRDEIAAWLRTHPRLRAVSLEAVTE